MGTPLRDPPYIQQCERTGYPYAYYDADDVECCSVDEDIKIENYLIGGKRNGNLKTQ